jgi:hypothetical protein
LVVDRQAGVAICSVYGDGSFRLKRVPLSEGSSRRTAIALAAPIVPLDGDHVLVGPETRRRIGENLSAGEGKGRFVPASPTWLVGYEMDDDQLDALTLGAMGYFNNSADTIDLETAGGVEVYLGEGKILTAQPFLGLYFDFDVGPGTLNQNLDLYGSSYKVYEDSSQYAVESRTALKSETAYRLPVTFYTGTQIGYAYVHEFAKLTFRLKDESYEYTESLDSKLVVEEGPLYGRHDLYWRIDRSKRQSTYDPARLGEAGTFLQLQLAGIMVQYHNKDYVGAGASEDPASALEAFATARARALLARRRLSVTGRLRGFGYLQEDIPDTTPLFLYRSLGRIGYATGYDYFYPAYYYGQAELDVRVNPFHDPYDSVRWYERFSLGVRGETGMVFTLDDGDLETGYPITLELALRGGVLVSPVREASWYCRVAFPLYDKGFFDTEWDYRIYFGFSL